MWFKRHGDRLTVSIKVKPNAKQNAVVGLLDDAILVTLKARPVEGKGNQALIKLLAEYLDLPQRQIKIKQGHLGRHKVIELPYSEKILQLLRR